MGILRAPGYVNLDLVLGKRINMPNGHNAQFGIEAFNALNHPSFGPPGRQLDSPNTFGVITSTISAPRIVELVFKYNF